MSLILFSSVALYLLYAKLEEDHGLARHAMTVYDRATKAVLPAEQYEVCYFSFKLILSDSKFQEYLRMMLDLLFELQP